MINKPQINFRYYISQILKWINNHSTFILLKLHQYSLSSKCLFDKFMKGFDNCSHNKIFKIINYMYYCAVMFRKRYICYSIEHCFYCLRKTKLIITFVLCNVQTKNKISITQLHKTKTIKWITVVQNKFMNLK